MTGRLYRRGFASPRRLLPTITLLLALGAPAAAEVVRFEVSERSDLLGGRAFGLAGAYERIVGVVHFAFDPGNPANRIVADIGLAPVNADGMSRCPPTSTSSARR